MSDAMAPFSKGVLKLLRREATLREWVEDGRDNYELSRAFHVPAADVRAAIPIVPGCTGFARRGQGLSSVRKRRILTMSLLK